MQIFDGKRHGEKLDDGIRSYIATHTDIKTLVIIQLGDDPASAKYVSLKERKCHELGVPVEVCYFPANLLESGLTEKITDIVGRESVGSVIIQLPLPNGVSKQILNIIPQAKDVDLLCEHSKKRFYLKDFSRLSPVMRALQYFIEHSLGIVKGKKVVVIGDGDLVGKPVAFYCRLRGAQVEVLDNYKKGTPIDGDLIVLAAGVPNLVKPADISKGACIIDYGSTVINSKTFGDLDSTGNMEHLGIVSLSPGGAGPLVVRFLIFNHLGI